jgi:tetratricopeptide (TPR) repeat protein
LILEKDYPKTGYLLLDELSLVVRPEVQMLLRYRNTLLRTAGVFVAATSFGIALGPVSAADPIRADESSAQQCDRYAARSLGLAAAVPGVSFEQLDPKKVIAACDAAVQRDPKNGRLLFELGRGYEKAGKFADALDHYRRAVVVGYAPAYASIGHMYSIGRGVEKDKRLAFEWFRNAADAGDPAGQFTLGQIYENGRGAVQDYKEALKWYQRLLTRDWLKVRTAWDIFTPPDWALRPMMLKPCSGCAKPRSKGWHQQRTI